MKYIWLSIVIFFKKRKLKSKYLSYLDLKNSYPCGNKLMNYINNDIFNKYTEIQQLAEELKKLELERDPNFKGL